MEGVFFCMALNIHLILELVQTYIFQLKYYFNSKLRYFIHLVFTLTNVNANILDVTVKDKEQQKEIYYK